MNIRLAFLPMLALTLPLTWLAWCPTHAQSENEPKQTAVISRGRQNIMAKLDSIRLETVACDGLPLGEVVRYLRAECHERDPDKRGVNFIINPSSLDSVPTGAPGAAPMEPVDISAIIIRIVPALTDVRLVDVLDAVVKVAERPIKYSIEDYAVVFSLKGSESPIKDETGFMFPGGTPNQFLNAVEKQYKVDWMNVVDLPREMEDVRIPRLRINQASLEAILARTARDNYPLEALISLYNQLGEQKPELGRLIVKGDLTKPSVVMFVPDKSMVETQPRIKVKAFSIAGIGEPGRQRLLKDIDLAREEAIRYADGVRQIGILRFLEGTVSIHNDTSLLIASGPEAFIETVESIVNASRTRSLSGTPETLAPTNTPGK